MKRRVLVTGCSSGIGLELAQRFLAQGWQVIAALRDATHAPAGLAGCAIVTLDLTDPAQIAAAAADIEELDCLVNNAGYALVGNFSGYSETQMRRQLDTNLLGPVLPCIRAGMPSYKPPVEAPAATEPSPTATPGGKQKAAAAAKPAAKEAAPAAPVWPLRSARCAARPTCTEPCATLPAPMHLSA